MIQFGFTEAQDMFRTHIRTFAQREIFPGAKERAKMSSICHDTMQNLVGMELLGLSAPEKYGGQNADWVTLGITLEELAKGDISAAHTTLAANLGSHIFDQLGPEQLKADWIPHFVLGQRTSCLMATEPNCGSDIASIQTNAVWDGDSYVINGEKTSVTGGMTADIGILVAKTVPSAKTKGISLFAVPLDLPGIIRSPFSDMGWLPIGRASVNFDQVRLSADSLMGNEGTGFYNLMRTFDGARVFLSLIALGAAEGCLYDAIAYAKQRTAFGKPIADFEGVSFKIAENATLIEAARLLCYHTLAMRDQGITHTKESAMCKWLGSKVAVRTCHDALITFGHFGYSDEHRVEQRLRDVIGYEIADGTPDIQKVVIAREIFG